MGLPITKERFKSKTVAAPSGDCMYWAGQRNVEGYGLYNKTRAHRLSYELHKGPIPKEIDGKAVVVRHKCDTPLCVNPEHLELGTQAQNMRDAAERKRMPRRLAHHWGVHSEEALDGVCMAIIRGEPNYRIAKRFGVSTPHISAIRHGKKEIERYTALGGVPATGRSDRQLTDEQAREAYSSRCTLAAVASKFGVSPATIRDIRIGRTYADVTGAGA
jgi:transcriptional regulator with XRE-family HTH domain